MAIYVDDLIHYSGWPWPSCHMMTDGPLSELFRMASDIGLKPAWFQNGKGRHPHYDLSSSYREKAIKNGAIPVSSIELLTKCDPQFAALLKKVQAKRMGKIL